MEIIKVDSGPLPEAVAASAAIPFLFAPVQIPGMEASGPFADGGARERIGLGPWRDRVRSMRSKGNEEEKKKKNQKELDRDPTTFALVHLIQRSFGPLSGNDSTASIEETNFDIVTSPKSGEYSFFLSLLLPSLIVMFFLPRRSDSAISGGLPHAVSGSLRKDSKKNRDSQARALLQKHPKEKEESLIIFHLGMHYCNITCSKRN